MQKTIFVVDDNDTNLSMAEEALEDQYRVLTLPSASKMFTLLEKITPDMILLDIEMPEMDGFEALLRLKGDPSFAGIPIIFLTGMSDAATEVRGFQLGVVDFVSKPFSAPVLLNRIRSHLNIDDIIRERTAQIQRLQNGILFVFADLVENRDEMTGGHVERTEQYIRVLADAMIAHGVYSDTMRGMDLELLSLSARLHDVGKIAIPDRVLNKPGRLEPDEWAVIKRHSAEGEHVIDQMVSRTDDVEFLRYAKLFAGYHHERWDGAGYPYGLKETHIPIQGRIMAVVDVYDALVSERSYKNAFSVEESIQIIAEGAGKHFDPYITDVFISVHDRFTDMTLDGPR